MVGGRDGESGLPRPVVGEWYGHTYRCSSGLCWLFYLSISLPHTLYPSFSFPPSLPPPLSLSFSLSLSLSLSLPPSQQSWCQQVGSVGSQQEPWITISISNISRSPTLPISHSLSLFQFLSLSLSLFLSFSNSFQPFYFFPRKSGFSASLVQFWKIILKIYYAKINIQRQLIFLYISIKICILNGLILTVNFKNLVKKISQKFARNPIGFLHTQSVAVL